MLDYPDAKVRALVDRAAVALLACSYGALFLAIVCSGIVVGPVNHEPPWLARRTLLLDLSVDSATSAGAAAQ